jgi:hypothetical protein
MHEAGALAAGNGVAEMMAPVFSRISVVIAASCPLSS